MSYSVKEIIYTLQGEGAQSGRAAVFCRFAGCNLWSGHESDRSEAVCRFCDTDFVGTDGPNGAEFASAGELADAIARQWPSCRQSSPAARPLVVCTGGEPLLQIDAPLIYALHARGFEMAIETNGTLPLPDGIDWVCVSPKAGSTLRLTAGDELKLIYPQPGAEPEQFEQLDFRHFFLQPMDGPDLARNTHLAVEYCLAHPRWRISLQTHKILGIP
jgi:7-carboxy-7-deazaguanine synthase (Cx14CxxC type)